MNGPRAQYPPVRYRGPVNLPDALQQGDLFRHARSSQSLEPL